VDFGRAGAAIRTIRIRKRLTQAELAAAASVSRGTVSRVERGLLDDVTLGVLAATCRALEIRLDLLLRWRGGELDRLLNAGHAGLLEAVSRRFARLPGWISLPEVTFSIYGERGSIDILAWHAASRSLLVVELKTAIVDVHDLLATLDRKRRLATQIGRERGWDAATVSVWVAVSDTLTNRRRVAAHETALRSVLPTGGVAVGRWLRWPVESIAALSFLSVARHESVRNMRPSRQRVRHSRKAVA
jgi:transcriptional regulator with XRE-family HTH domain